MNRKAIFNITAKAVRLEALMMLLPMIVSIIYHEDAYKAFLVTSVCAFLASSIVLKATKDCSNSVYEKEGFIIVSLVWIVMSLIGAVPYVLCGDIPSYVDALFETVSGLSTTGATILTKIEVVSHGALFWRSFAHWIGGMGILVLIVMLSSKVQGRTMMILKAEMPGPTKGKLVPKAHDTAFILYSIYIGLSVLQTFLLMAGGMSLFDAVIHMFGTAGTGGFSSKTASMSYFNNYCQWVVIAFMIIFGINFNLYYMMLKGKIKEALKSEELRVYLAILLISFVAIFFNIRGDYSNADAIRASAFQVSSLMTTTGFSTANYNAWPSLGKGILIVLMFIGGCAGSTAGGLKVSRIIIAFKAIRQEMITLTQPRRVRSMTMDGKRLEESTVRQTMIFFVLYFVILMIATILIMAIEPVNFISGFSAVVACLSNVGPGLGTFGPLDNFAHMKDISKLILTVAMLFGRLEIYPILLTFSRRAWKD